MQENDVVCGERGRVENRVLPEVADVNAFARCVSSRYVTGAAEPNMTTLGFSFLLPTVPDSLA